VVCLGTAFAREGGDDEASPARLVTSGHETAIISIGGSIQQDGTIGLRDEAGRSSLAYVSPAKAAGAAVRRSDASFSGDATQEHQILPASRGDDAA
jgi:hypothetical protein